MLLHRLWEFTTFQMSTAACARGVKQLGSHSAKGSSCFRTLHRMLPKQRDHPDHKKDMDFVYDGKNYDLV